MAKKISQYLMALLVAVALVIIAYAVYFDVFAWHMLQLIVILMAAGGVSITMYFIGRAEGTLGLASFGGWYPRFIYKIVESSSSKSITLKPEVETDGCCRAGGCGHDSYCG